ncbi:uncharacterized protein [Paramormyrops kingsleyae]|uniref:uncharacterized protein isoform X5 n=1 Tax=Paramormyrops kingsleyae TaxID=1676925 RepID=UPI003B977BEA
MHREPQWYVTNLTSHRYLIHYSLVQYLLKKYLHKPLYYRTFLGTMTTMCQTNQGAAHQNDPVVLVADPGCMEQEHKGSPIPPPPLSPCRQHVLCPKAGSMVEAQVKQEEVDAELKPVWTKCEQEEAAWLEVKVEDTDVPLDHLKEDQEDHPALTHLPLGPRVKGEPPQKEKTGGGQEDEEKPTLHHDFLKQDPSGDVCAMLLAEAEQPEAARASDLQVAPLDAPIVGRDGKPPASLPYTCGECGKAFNRKAYLRRHQRLHSGRTAYRCSQCDKSCKDAAALRIHWRTHTKETPYQCVQCGKSFTQRGSLKAHHRVHTGLRQKLPGSAAAGDAPAHPLRGDAVCVPHLWAELQTGKRPGETSAPALAGGTLSLHRLRTQLPQLRGPTQAPAGPLRRDTVPLQRVWQALPATALADAAWARAQRGAPLHMHAAAVWQGLQAAGAAEGASAHAHQGDAVPLH